MRIRKFYIFALTAVLLFSNLNAAFGERECPLCPCCDAEACALSLTAPPCCELCERSANEIAPYDALQPESQVQLLRALAPLAEPFAYPPTDDSAFSEQVLDPHDGFASQPPIYLRCEVLLI